MRSKPPSKLPRTLGPALARVRRAAAPPTLLASVQERWSDSVGADVSGHAEPVSERAGVVTVACRSAVWSAELATLSATLLEGLNEALPEGRQVRALKFVTRPG